MFLTICSSTTGVISKGNASSGFSVGSPNDVVGGRRAGGVPERGVTADGTDGSTCEGGGCIV